MDRSIFGKSACKRTSVLFSVCFSNVEAASLAHPVLGVYCGQVCSGEPACPDLSAGRAEL